MVMIYCLVRVYIFLKLTLITEMGEKYSVQSRIAKKQDLITVFY